MNRSSLPTLHGIARQKARIPRRHVLTAIKLNSSITRLSAGIIERARSKPRRDNGSARRVKHAHCLSDNQLEQLRRRLKLALQVIKYARIYATLNWLAIRNIVFAITNGDRHGSKS